MSDDSEDIARGVFAIHRISAVPALLSYICRVTGLGFAAVARITDSTWVACAVEDRIGLEISVGIALEAQTTLCSESRALRQPIVIDHASRGDAFRDHCMPLSYRIESYLSMPIVRSNGEYFGNLCAMDRQPRVVSDPQTLAMFKIFADLIAMQLDSEERQDASDQALLDAIAASDLREQFIAVLGYDLRNPLAAVGATAELLTRRQEPEIIRLGDRLKATTRRMSRLIDDVLDFARGRLGTGIGVRSKRAMTWQARCMM